MIWAEHAETWPHASSSRFVETRSNNWHVQIMGSGPSVLLIHGAGGSTHSWRDVMETLSNSAKVIAVDLPGQGFTTNHHRTRLSLPAMAEDIAQLLETLGETPDMIVGHSAGAAIMFQMAFEPKMDVLPKLVSINGALGNFDGIAGLLFPIMAKFLSMNPLTALVFAKFAMSERSAQRLISSTGSQINADGLALYRHLFSDRTHVDRTLAMMAQWSLDGLTQKMASLSNETLFLVGNRDKAVPNDISKDAAAGMKNARVEHYDTAGHLLHEEHPEQIARRVLDFLNDVS